MNIGERIKILRESKNLTQEALASIIGSTDATITRYEKGQREPSIEVLTKIADAFDIELFELMVDKEEVLKRWNSQLDTDKVRKELQLQKLLQELYPNDYDFIIDLFTRLGLLKSE